MTQVPQALQPRYRTLKVNQEVRLYNGPIQIAGGGKVRTANDAEAALSWLPAPRLLVRSGTGHPGATPQSFSVGIFCDDFWCWDDTGMFWHGDWYHTEARYSRVVFNSTAGSAFTFRFDRLRTGIGKNLTSVDFHIVNLPNFLGEAISEGPRFRQGRIRLSAEGWEIVIDNLDETDGLSKELRETVGFAITHFGNLRRSDESSFGCEEVDEILRALYYFLSFARGRWTPPILLSGDGLNGERWKEWGMPPFIDHGASEWSWPPRLKEGSALSSAWPGFLRLWLKGGWRDPLIAALSWYIEAAKGVLIESHLVTGQAALELLSWVEHVEQRGLFTADGFRRLKAEDRLQLLLVLNHIALEIPAALPELKARAKASSWPDGARALVQLRNGIVHPNLRQRVLGVDIEIRAQAWQLMMHYLQLVLLRLFEYTGQHFDRLEGKEATVPWAEP